MDHDDHVALICDAVTEGGTWADLGSGTGAFTLALAELVGPLGTIHSVDKDGRALRQQEQRIRARFAADNVRYIKADINEALELPPLDGVLMANSLHFFRYKTRVLQRVRSYLKPDGVFVLVEYDADRGNAWVPHPLSFATWEGLATENGFAGTRLLATVPSRFLGRIYSAVSSVGSAT